MNVTLRQTIEQEIKNTPVIMYSKTWCGFCDGAKEILRNGEVSY